MTGPSLVCLRWWTPAERSLTEVGAVLNSVWAGGSFESEAASSEASNEKNEATWETSAMVSL